MVSFGGVLDFFGGVGDFVGETFDTVSSLGSSFFSVFDDDGVWGSISSLAGNILLEGANTYAAIEASDAALDAGESAANVFFGNADLLYDEALLVEGRTQDAVTKGRLNGLRLLSQQVVGYSKSGVTLEGSPLMVINETRDLIEQELIELQSAGQAQADRLRRQGEIEDRKAQNALDEATFKSEAIITQSIVDSVKGFF